MPHAEIDLFSGRKKRQVIIFITSSHRAVLEPDWAVQKPARPTLAPYKWSAFLKCHQSEGCKLFNHIQTN